MSEHVIDAIREGKAPDVIRRKAAEGGLPVPLEETIEILTLLTRDKNEEIRKKALDTLYNWDRQELQRTLANPATPPAVLDFATNYLASGCLDLLEALMNNPNLPGDLREEIESHMLSAARQETAKPQQPPVPSPPVEPAAPETQGPEAAEKETLIQKINRMSAVEKIKAALTGNQETRMILIRDPNKLVARAVLQSPKLSDVEIETFAAMKDLAEEVLRHIATNRHFMKSYTVMRALINNPRAPTDATLPLLGRLHDKDLKLLAKNRNVPDAIRLTAIKILRQKADAARRTFTRRET